MVTPEMLPVLQLRRQAASHGWRFAGSNSDGTFFYRREDEDGVHQFQVDPGYCPPRGEDFSAYRSGSGWAHTTDGDVMFAHVSVAQAVAILRGFAGWVVGS